VDQDQTPDQLNPSCSLIFSGQTQVVTQSIMILEQQFMKKKDLKLASTFDHLLHPNGAIVEPALQEVNNVL
jgi:hypothetical protein